MSEPEKLYGYAPGHGNDKPSVSSSEPEVPPRFQGRFCTAHKTFDCDECRATDRAEAAAPAPKPEPILKPQNMTAEEMLRHGLEKCVAEHDETCTDRCKCRHSAIHGARFLVGAFQAESASSPDRPPLSDKEIIALRQILDYAQGEHGKSQQGYFSGGGWAGETLRGLLKRAEVSPDRERDKFMSAERFWQQYVDSYNAGAILVLPNNTEFAEAYLQAALSREE